MDKTAAKYGWIATGMLTLFAWLAPTHTRPWPSFHEEFAMALAGLVAGATVLLSRRSPCGLQPLTLVTLSTAVVPLVQWSTGLIVFGGDAALPFLYLVGFALAQTVGQRVTARQGIESVLTWSSAVLLTGALCSTWLALCQWQQLEYFDVALSDMPAGGRPFGNLNQPNQHATLVVLGIVATAFLFDAGRFGAVTALLSLTLLGMGLAVPQSRVGVVEVLVVGALVLAARRRAGARLRWHHVLLGIAVVLSMTGVFTAVNALQDQVPGRTAAEISTAGLRTVHWASMVDAISQRPWTGYGWSQTVLAQYAVAPKFAATGEILGYSHNLLLDLLVWNGIPLGLVIATALTAWFVGAWRGARASSAIFALASVVAVFTHALVEFPLAYLYFLLPTGFLMGAVGQATMPALAWTAPRWFAPSLLAGMALACAVVGRDFFRVEDDVLALRVEAARIGLNRPRHELSSPVILTQLGAFTHFVRDPDHPGMTDAELASMGAVVKRFPSSDNLLRYAAALAVNDRADESASVLKHICLVTYPADCRAKQARWLAVGQKVPLVGAVAWPADSR